MVLYQFHLDQNFFFSPQSVIVWHHDVRAGLLPGCSSVNVSAVSKQHLSAAEAEYTEGKTTYSIVL